MSTTVRPRYFDPALSAEERTEDLLGRMTLEEKAGQLFHPATVMNDDGTLLAEPNEDYAAPTQQDVVADRHITHLHLMNGEDPYAIAGFHNLVQELAESTRLGIPITLSTDPRHGFFSSPTTGQTIDALSRWPEHPGMAALPDAERRVAEYADIVRREYLAMGFRVALGPMADIFSEPRWSRGFGTFGEDPATVARLTAAFLTGLRGGPELGPDSVSAVVKHFPGGGPQLKGNDAHDLRYPEQVYPGDGRALHIKPFEQAIAAGATQIMTYYGKPVGTDWPELAFAFNKPVVQGILRDKLGFDGIVITDWYVIQGTTLHGIPFGPNSYGLEHLPPLERIATALGAGVDQFGGDQCPELVVELVESGRVPVARLDSSVRRLLQEKFRLGLFEHRYVDPERTRTVAGSAPFRSTGRKAQADSTVLLKNTGNLLPLAEGTKVYTEGIAPEALHGRAEVVPSPAQADVAVLRLHAPWREDPNGMTAFFHGGDLDFTPDQIAHVQAIAAEVPTVLLVYLERPAILREVELPATAVVADFGAEDDVLAEIVFGDSTPQGRLPFDLPISMAAVNAHPEDVPFSTKAPLHRHGDGLAYETTLAAEGRARP
ncbi:glycoside hydrolase family 3 protein [Streptomyces sp. NPDC001212]